MHEATKEAMWLWSLLVNIHRLQLSPTIVFIDNQNAIRMAQNLVFHAKTKHIETHYHFTHEQVDLQYVPIALQKVNFLIKPLS
jgi:hypothetical protein